MYIIFTRATKRNAMFKNIVFIVICAFQVVYGQADPENDLEVLFNNTNQELNEIILPLVTRQQTLAYENGEERVNLEIIRDDLREELVSNFNLTTDDPLIPKCLMPALEDLARIVDSRVDALTEFTINQFSNISDVLMNISFVRDEEKSLELETEQSIENCKAQETEEEINDCISGLIPTFNETAVDIINRVREQVPLAEDVLTTAEDNQKNIIKENRNYIDENIQTTSDDLTTCMES